MSKITRRTVASLLALLLLIGAAPAIAASAAAPSLGAGIEVSTASTRLLTTVNAFAEDPYTKVGQTLFKNIPVAKATKTLNNTSKTKYFTGSNASDFLEEKLNAQNIKFDITAAATFYGVTVKVGYGLNYKHSTAETTNRYTNEFYYNLESTAAVATYNLDSINSQNLQPLRDALDPVVLNQLLTSTNYDWLYNNYGTHLVLGYSAGGTFELRARASTVDTKKRLTESTDTTHTIPISASAIAKVVDISTTTTINDIVNVAQSWTDSSITKTITSGTVGGPPLTVDILTQSPAAVREQVQNWMNSVNESNANIIADQNLNLVPIWELLPANALARKAELIREFYKHSNEINDKFDKSSVYYTGTWPQREEDGYQPISSAAELRAKLTAAPLGRFYLTQDIDLGNAAWTPIQFGGILDGQGYKISGLNVADGVVVPSLDAITYAGFFSCLSGTVKNLTIAGTVKGKQIAGGFAGTFRGGKLYNCVNEVNVIQGDNRTTNWPRAGGFAGEALSAAFENCTNKGSVTGNCEIDKSAPADGSTNLGVGGIVGANTVKAGYSSNTTIKACANTGAVTANGTKNSNACGNAGGIVGMINSGRFYIENCYNTGAVQANSVAGGMIGWVMNQTTGGYGGGSPANTGLSYCYNEGIISKYNSATKQPAFVGAAESAYNGFATKTTNFYLNNTLISLADNTYGNPLANESQFLKASFPNWDFTSIWKINSGKGPTLRQKAARISINPIKTAFPEYGLINRGDLSIDVIYGDGSRDSTLTQSIGFTLIYNFDKGDPANFKEKVAVKFDDCLAEIDVNVVGEAPEKLEVIERTPLVTGQSLADSIVLQCTMNNGAVVIADPSEITVENYNAANTQTPQNVDVTYKGAKITLRGVTVSEPPVQFTAVAGITGVPTRAVAGTPLQLSGTVTPAGATNQTIAWSLVSAGTTGATLSNNGVLTATAAGTVTVRATVANGLTAQSDFSQTFTINVEGNGGDEPVVTPKTIFTTKWEATTLNWILFFLAFGFIWMWFINP